MRSILCVASGLPSVVYQSVELARRLAAAGHRVVFAGEAASRELVEHHRLEFLPLEPGRYERFLADDARVPAPRRLLRLRQRRRQARESLAVVGFARAVDELDPDLVLINGEMHEQIIVVAGAGRRLGLLNTFTSIWRRPGLPPPHRLVRPGVGLLGSRPGISLLWLELRLRRWLRLGWQRVRRLGCDRVSVLRSLAREVGFDFRRETDFGQWLMPFTYRRLPVLSLQALELELPHRPPRRVRYVGPMVLESRVDRPLAEKDRRRLAALLGRCRRGGGDRRLIYAGFGSAFTARAELVRRLVTAVSERPGWELLLSLGGRPAPAALGPLPRAVHAFAWVPQPSVLGHADAAVIHGGINTINECVLHGVPMLIYCGFETDMAGSTARAVHHGIAIAGGRDDRPAAIRRGLERLLREPGFRQSLDRLRPRFAAYAGERLAERAVERLLREAPGAGGASRGPSGSGR